MLSVHVILTVAISYISVNVIFVGISGKFITSVNVIFVGISGNVATISVNVIFVGISGNAAGGVPAILNILTLYIAHYY